MRGILLRPWHLVLALLLAALAPGVSSAQLKLSRDAFLEQLWNLKPAERMDMISKAVKKGDFGSAERGAVSEAIIERAYLDAARKSDIICRIQPNRNNIVAIIKWVVDDGATVKKGDKIIEFDALPAQAELKIQKQIVADANAKLQTAEAQLQRVQKDNAIDVRLAEIDVRLAELALKQYKGNDAEQKQILALQIDRASLLHMRVKSQSEVKEEKATGERNAKKVVYDREMAQQKELEKVIANCIVHAPQDGMLVYYEPAQRRPKSPQAIVAQGEPVREGQKLMTICDLKQMVAVAKVHEASISKVRVGQKTTIRVDAFPQRIQTGKVTQVAAVADQAEFFSKDVKVYRVEITIDANDASLRPGLSAEASISIAERPNCLRLPFGTVLTRKNEKYCYVQVDKELQMRKLTIGATDGSFVEVVDGLKEGDSVLRFPQVVVDRLLRMKSK